MNSGIDPEAVYGAVRQIPPGTVITYADLAERVGRSRESARAIGNILRNRPDNDAWMTTAAEDHDIPWWRVVKADGTLLSAQDDETGYKERWVEWARAQLMSEGVAFTDSGRVASLSGPRHGTAEGGRRSRSGERLHLAPAPCWRHDTIQYSCRDCAPSR